MSPFMLETVLHWIAVGLYIGATVLYAHAILFAHPERIRRGTWTALAGLLPHSAALVVRYLEVGHGPYMLKYEVLSSNAWIVTVMLLLFIWRRQRWAPLALVTLPVVILMLGLGSSATPRPGPCRPPFAPCGLFSMCSSTSSR
jgi:ABC-type uncharacterized transport system permease subunit